MSPGWNAVTARTRPRAEPFDATAAAVIVSADARSRGAPQFGQASAPAMRTVAHAEQRMADELHGD